MKAGQPENPSWQRAELWTAALITLWVVVLHGVYLFHAGPLWRDEVGTIDFAAMPTVADIWRNLRYDNFPPLFVAVARVWTLAGLNSDFSYRVLGFLVGMGTVGVLWFSARKLGGHAPLLALAFYAVNPLAVWVGDSLRPYGLGITLILLTSALIWNFVQAPTRKTLFWAVLAATLSVHCLYQNAFFLIAFSCGAWAVTLGQRQWKVAGQIGIIGLIAAFSLLPYYVNIKTSREWIDISRRTIPFHEIWDAFSEALHNSGKVAVPIWLAFWVVGPVAAIFYTTGPRRWQVVYGGTILATSAIFYFVFLRALGLVLHPWYFLILMAPAALMMDSIWGAMRTVPLRVGRAVLAVVVVLASGAQCYAGTQLRQSNVDLVAAKLKEEVQPGDLVVVNPWYFGVSLQRHWDSSNWITLPPMDELRIHRYDLMKEAMMSENPIGPVLEKVSATLRSGHNLWVVGVFQTPPPGNPQPVLPPYHGGLEKAESWYFSSWMFQLSGLVQKHAVRGIVVKIPVPKGQIVNSAEEIPLLVIHGWRN